MGLLFQDPGLVRLDHGRDVISLLIFPPFFLLLFMLPVLYLFNLLEYESFLVFIGFICWWILMFFSSPDLWTVYTYTFNSILYCVYQGLQFHSFYLLYQVKKKMQEHHGPISFYISF